MTASYRSILAAQRNSDGSLTPIYDDSTTSLATRVSALELLQVILPSTYTVDTLPSPQDNLGRYATVTDLFGEKVDKVLASSYTRAGVTKYFWQPVRPDYGTSMAAATMNLIPLKTPSFLRLTGNLSASRTLSLSLTNAWPGARFKIKMTGLLNLNTLTLAGLDLGATLSLLTGGTKEVMFDGAAWQDIS